MGMSISGDKSGSDLSSQPGPARARAAADSQNAKPASRGEGSNSGFIQVVNPARDDIAELLGEANIDNTLRVPSPISIAAARAAFSAF